jgi:ABC-2 type transport system ATP-binding protein
MCDTLIFMDRGRIVHHGDTHTLRRGTEGPVCMVDIAVEGPVAPLLAWLTVRPGWRLVSERNHGVRAEFSGDDSQRLAAELKRLIADGIAVSDFHREERRLEEAFVEMLREPPVLKTGGGGPAS